MFILILSLLLWLNTANANGFPSSQFVCRAPEPQANLCQTSDSFTPVTEPGLDLGISNPINMISGDKFLKESDLPESINGLLSFVRFYRSDSTQQNGFGVSWLSNYSISAHKQSNQSWLIRFPDGKTFTSQNIRLENDNLHWQAGQKRNFTFDLNGKLTALQTPKTGLIKLRYYEQQPYLGYLKSIHLADQNIQLNYQIIDQTVLLHSLDTHLGRFTYHYDNTYLVKVVRPDGMQRNYEYDKRPGLKHLITGISITNQQGKTWQARGWQYDDQARVIKAWPGKSTNQALSFDYQLQQTTIKSAKASSKIQHSLINNQNRISQQSTQTNNQFVTKAVSYDSSGKLKSIHGLQIERYKNGQIKTLKPNSGWPGLSLKYEQQGHLVSWFSNISNTTQVFYHDNGLLQGLLYANGDRLEINPDTVGRPVKLNYTSPHSPDIAINLSWHGQQLSKLENQHETEFLTYDEGQRLKQRTIVRESINPIRYDERFAYDTNGRLIRHDIPEGGQLIYEWLANSIINIKWLDQHGKTHTVIKTTDNKAGYTHGNGLHTQVLYGRHNSWLVLNQHNQILWGEHRLNDQKGNLIKQNYLANNKLISTDFTYDEFNRTIAYTKSTNNNLNWLAWATDGSLKAHTDINHKRAIQRDTSALPKQIGQLKLEYQAQRRLHKIIAGTDVLAKYFYNARGQRIYQKYRSHSAHRLYVDNRLSAIWHIKNQQIVNKQRFIYAHGIAVGLIETDSQNNSKLYFVHNNQIGAPVLVSDHKQNIVWQADYDIFGFANIKISRIKMPLRLPGQDADPVSGWHDNVFRTYLPKFGQYLEPDPLGPLPGQQAFGYAAQQALRYTDPLGLVLLAFDGTRYNKSNRGNVWKLSQIYNDGPSFYHHGPGNSYYLDWDAVVAASSRQIQQNQWQSLMNVLEKAQNQGQTVPIDILGYSRGAALARDFANKIAANTNNGWFNYNDPIRGNIALCVNLRFLGLFDTVAQFGILGAANAGYDLEITGAWQWVAHAIASHELRTLFPLVSATTDHGLNTIEVPFIGAHADIGGGMVLDDQLQPVPNGDLSDVALNWMYWQAQAAMVTQNELTAVDRLVSEPWLHDARNVIEKNLLSGDRNIQDSNTNTIGPQGEDRLLGNDQRHLFEQFITRIKNHPQAQVVGTVDMQAYSLWLQQSLGMPEALN